MMKSNQNPLHNVFSSGFTFSSNETELKYKVLFINVAFLFSGVVAFLIGIKRFIAQQYPMAIADMIYGVIALIIIYFLRKNKNKIKLFSKLTALVVFIFVFMILFIADYPARISLLFILVATAFFLLGKKGGLISVILSILTLLTTHFILYINLSYSDFEIILISTFLIVFFTILSQYENQKNENFEMLESLNENLEQKVEEQTKDLIKQLELVKIAEQKQIELRNAMEEKKLYIEKIHNETKDSIEYASLIQSSLIPKNEQLNSFFKDYFIMWEPKDIVGGDIYLFDTLRNCDESLLLVIDCTGHGVPGAFVTMLVKALEREIISTISKSDFEVSPAIILSHFNKRMKKLLNQENLETFTDTGFDGGVVYINKKTNILKYAGACTTLFYIKDDKIEFIKGNRHSIGYKYSDVSYKFTEHVIDIQENMKFYISTDGYIDQKGGEKGLPFGKRKFQQIIKQEYIKDMKLQKDIFLNELRTYQQNYKRVDDITVVAFQIR